MNKFITDILPLVLVLWVITGCKPSIQPVSNCISSNEENGKMKPMSRYKYTEQSLIKTITGGWTDEAIGLSIDLKLAQNAIVNYTEVDKKCGNGTDKLTMAYVDVEGSMKFNSNSIDVSGVYEALESLDDSTLGLMVEDSKCVFTTPQTGENRLLRLGGACDLAPFDLGITEISFFKKSDSGPQTVDPAKNQLETFAVAVGKMGTIIHCDIDSCLNMKSPTEVSLIGVKVFSSERAFIVGSGGVILRWDGQHWEKQVSPTGKTLYSVDGISEDFMFAVGKDGIILHYDGLDWVEVNSPVTNITGFALREIDIYNKNFGIAVGGIPDNKNHGAIITFNGTAWTIDRLNLDQELDAVGISSENYAVAGGFSDKIDGEPLNLIEWNGDKWKNVGELPWRRYVTSIAFSSENIGFALTDGGDSPLILKYFNKTWESIEHNITTPLTNVHMISENIAFAVGAPETLNVEGSHKTIFTIIKWDGETWSKIDTSHLSDGFVLTGVGGEVEK